VSGAYGSLIRGLRTMTLDTVDKEPKWRHRGSTLSTGYQKPWR
jgi:hydrogenase small subunit